MNKHITLIGVLLICLGIVLGAFGAHALKAVISESKLASYEVGVRYQIYHGLAIFVLGLNADRIQFKLNWVYRLILSGVLLFSVSIYLLALEELIGPMKFLGPITPIGGVLLISAWSLFIIKLLSSKRDSSSMN